MAGLKIVFVMASFFVALSFAAPTTDEEALQIPQECIGQRYCSVKPEGYEELEEKINSILPEVLVKEYADRSGEPSFKPETLSPEKDWHNCPHKTKMETWYAYYHGPNNTKPEYIVQTKLLVQEFGTVNCAYEHIDSSSDVQCFQDLDVVSFGMQSKCVTSYTMRTFYVFDLKRNLIVQKPFPVPSCCQCRVRNNDEEE